MKNIFIAATKQNDGKTTVSLGLICNLKNRFKNVAFIKPIGQRYLEEEGLKIDEDSVLVEHVLGIKKSQLKDMSPIAVEKGFTEAYISKPDPENISRQIRQSYGHITKGCDLVVIEGTGHAGVGSVFDHSNAKVARLLGSKVIIISSGGIGRPIDEILLNKALFEKEGVKVAGVIVNKVLPEKFEKIKKLVKQGLARKGVEVFGVMPYNPMLSYPKVNQILEETDYKLLCGNKSLNRVLSKIIVGAMTPQDACPYIVDHTLLITPGDREDIINMALNCVKDDNKEELKISCIVLTGGIMPSKDVMDTLEAKSIPVLLTNNDTYDVASTIHDLTVKIRPEDKDKIDMAVKFIKDYVDLDKILERM
jgi:BioD-like phosphotransacetylase family protein